MENHREMQPQIQSPYRRQARPGLDIAARRAAQQREQASGQFFGRIPKSVVINFVVLVVLFCIVYALQTFGDRFKSKPTAAQPAARSISTASLPAIPEPALPQAMPAPVTAQAQVADAAALAANAAVPVAPAAPAAVAAAPTAAAEPAGQPAPAAASVYTLPQKPAAAPAVNNDEDIKPAIDEKKTAIAKKQAIAAQRMRGDAWAEDRRVSVDELDGESARELYNKQNRGVPYSPPPRYERSAQAPMPRYEEPSARSSRHSEPGVYDLDSESARESYLTANQKNSSWADEGKSARKKAGPAPLRAHSSDDDYIPYEQSR